MDDLGIFLAHAIQLEDESAQRMDEMAAVMETHHNTEAGALFRKLAHYSRLHLAEVKSKADKEAVDLPHIAPWEYQWPGNESPELAGWEGAHYKMTPHHALRLALESEQAGNAFYREVAEQTKNDKVRSLATEMADEEAEHVSWIEELLLKFPPPPPHWDEDLDPPGPGD